MFEPLLLLLLYYIFVTRTSIPHLYSRSLSIVAEADLSNPTGHQP